MTRSTFERLERPLGRFDPALRDAASERGATIDVNDEGSPSRHVWVEGRDGRSTTLEHEALTRTLRAVATEP